MHYSWVHDVIYKFTRSSYDTKYHNIFYTHAGIKLKTNFFHIFCHRDIFSLLLMKIIKRPFKLFQYTSTYDIIFFRSDKLILYSTRLQRGENYCSKVVPVSFYGGFSIIISNKIKHIRRCTLKILYYIIY